MIPDKLKSEWALEAFIQCEKDPSIKFAPARGAFTGYLGRLFKRDALSHVEVSNFLNNIELILSEIQKDVDANKPSTGTVAKYLHRTLREVVEAKVKAALEQTDGIALSPPKPETIPVEPKVEMTVEERKLSQKLMDQWNEATRLKMKKDRIEITQGHRSAITRNINKVVGQFGHLSDEEFLDEDREQEIYDFLDNEIKGEIHTFVVPYMKQAL